MMAASGLSYQECFDLLVKVAHDPNPAGRKMAHAMAHGWYACRTYAIVYNEETGKFAFVRA